MKKPDRKRIHPNKAKAGATPITFATIGPIKELVRMAKFKIMVYQAK